MKTLRLFFVFLLAIMASNLSAQDLKMEVLQGYSINPSTKEFRGDVYLSGGKKVTNMSMTLVYSSVNTTIPFEFYASGTRDYNGVEAKDKWWTNNPPNFFSRTGYKDSVEVTFRVGTGSPVETINRFHPLELYFHFLNTANYKVGDVITINVCNIKVTLDGGQNIILPNTQLIVTIGGVSSVNDSKFSNNEVKIYPNPASDFINIDFVDTQNEAVVELISVSGCPLGIYRINGFNSRISVNDLPNGNYFIKVNNLYLPVLVNK